MTTTQDIVAKLWDLCHVLRDDGVTYHEYATELTYVAYRPMLLAAREAGPGNPQHIGQSLCSETK